MGSNIIQTQTLKLKNVMGQEDFLQLSYTLKRDKKRKKRKEKIVNLHYQVIIQKKFWGKKLMNVLKALVY